MGAMTSQITSLTIVYSTVYSGADQRKRQSSASLAFVRGINRGPVNSPHKWPVTRKMLPFYDVIMFKRFVYWKLYSPDILVSHIYIYICIYYTHIIFNKLRMLKQPYFCRENIPEFHNISIAIVSVYKCRVLPVHYVIPGIKICRSYEVLIVWESLNL